MLHDKNNITACSWKGKPSCIEHSVSQQKSFHFISGTPDHYTQTINSEQLHTNQSYTLTVLIFNSLAFLCISLTTIKKHVLVSLSSTVSTLNKNINTFIFAPISHELNAKIQDFFHVYNIPFSLKYCSQTCVNLC